MERTDAFESLGRGRRWAALLLAETGGRGYLAHYFTPPLPAPERGLAGREGWMLGVA